MTCSVVVSLFCALYSYWQFRRDKTNVESKAEVLPEVVVVPKNFCVGKEKYLHVLLQAGLPQRLVTPALCRQLPSEDQVAQLYGKQPIIHGLDRCAEYRSRLQRLGNNNNTAAALPPPLAPLVRVTGLYNTGTNAFHMALHVNLKEDSHDKNDTATTTKRQVTDPDEIEMMFGVPWFKHFPIQARSQWIKGQSMETVNRILTIVLIRDPYRWMQSMVSA